MESGPKTDQRAHAATEERFSSKKRTIFVSKRYGFRRLFPPPAANFERRRYRTTVGVHPSRSSVPVSEAAPTPLHLRLVLL